MTRKCFLPPHIGERIPGHPTQGEQFMRQVRQLREPAIPVGGIRLYTAGNRQVEPGQLLPSLDDARAKEAYTGLTSTLVVLKSLGIPFGQAGLIATVHYGADYDNAFWDGTQMVFGDGDRHYFQPFTGPIDVCAHELGHGVTGNRLNYHGQAGALNESMSDCIGVTVRQQALNLAQDDPTAWLIGYGLFTQSVKGSALRHMLYPGTAYDDPYLGKDPQPKDMAGYVTTTDDDGGVHTNSGIPNRAFALAAMGLGNTLHALAVWEKALDTLGNPAATFEDFANATVQAASDPDDAQIIRGAWVTVGVLTAAQPQPQPQPPSGGTADISFLDPTVQAHIQHVAKTAESVGPWMNHHFRSYFRIK